MNFRVQLDITVTEENDATVARIHSMPDGRVLLQCRVDQVRAAVLEIDLRTASAGLIAVVPYGAVFLPARRD